MGALAGIKRRRRVRECGPEENLHPTGTELLRAGFLNDPTAMRKNKNKKRKKKKKRGKKKNKTRAIRDDGYTRGRCGRDGGDETETWGSEMCTTHSCYMCTLFTALFRLRPLFRVILLPLLCLLLLARLSPYSTIFLLDFSVCYLLARSCCSCFSFSLAAGSNFLGARLLFPSPSVPNRNSRHLKPPLR